MYTLGLLTVHRRCVVQFKLQFAPVFQYVGMGICISFNAPVKKKTTQITFQQGRGLQLRQVSGR